MEPYRAADGAFVVCPYCAEPLAAQTEAARLAAHRDRDGGRAPVPCGTCALDVTRDAPVEERRVEGRPRVACRHCGALVLADAFFCHHCRKWQAEPFER